LTAIGLLFFVASLDAPAADQPGNAKIESADALFKAGQFADAGKIYRQLATQDPKSYRAAARLGYIALLSNRLDESREWLEKAAASRPDESSVKPLLAEVFYRRDEFEKAGRLLSAIGAEPRAKMLASFKGLKPYEVQGSSQTTSVKFVMTDPLPVVQVRVNGGKEVNFFIDTGGAEVILDTAFAREIGIPQFGSQTGNFAGGKKAAVGHGRIDSLALGDWVIKNLPAGVLNTRQFSKPVFGGKQIDGILGTVLFYHFITTLDYPGGKLILRRKTAENLKEVEQEGPGKTAVVPFWMAGDHFMVAWARINNQPPTLLFVDTGAAGVGVSLAESTIKAAGIELMEDRAGEGVGGGGKVRVVPFVVKDLSLGDVHQQNVPGTFNGPFAFEHSFGFRLAGIISHSFFKPYALTFDFEKMRLLLRGRQ